MKVCSSRNFREGGIILSCENTNETMKVKQIVNEKFGDNYEVVLPKVKYPRIRVSNIDEWIPKESIIEELKKHNEQIKDIDMRLVTVIPKKRRSYSSNDLVIEVKNNSFQKLLDIDVLDLPWRECKISEHIHVNRCFKFFGFFHKSNECKHD